MAPSPLSHDHRGTLAALLGDTPAAHDSLVHQLAQNVHACMAHDHPALHCLSLSVFMGEQMGPVLRRLLDAEAEVERLTTEVDGLRRAVSGSVGAAVRSVHQRGHEVHLPLELLEFLTGRAETAALADPDAVPRDGFEVVISSSGTSHTVAEEVRCMRCGGITTQAGFDGQGWTLERLDRMADRHRCLPRVSTDDALDEIQDDTCVEFCNEDPKTACTLSGRRHVHPASQGAGFGPCPVHPDAPGDL
ncbi:hypothetical protein ACGFWD_26775 [Streptomyces sp. NPDC048448]|uniref:hypothetical protein n=1 Tax=unclassified Streptomyces TaxID=2593676 RepID=UPI00225A8D22|nr:hypothetical protein [Streptomyces sp. NBC_01571]MCX4581096.1 hypothetical protein [Streptomyces sp. NBC_01571]